MFPFPCFRTSRKEVEAKNPKKASKSISRLQLKKIIFKSIGSVNVQQRIIKEINFVKASKEKKQSNNNKSRKPLRNFKVLSLNYPSASAVSHPSTNIIHRKKQLENILKPPDPEKRRPLPEFICSVCGAKFLRKVILQTHFARKHSEDYNFPCKECGKKFKVKSDLTTHMRFHLEPPVVCHTCGKTYLNSRYLYLHQRYAHYQTAFPCHICKRFLATQKNLDQHIHQQHGQKERVICDECGKSFCTIDTLRRHVQFVHFKVRSYSCEICSKLFARRSELRQHLLIHTGKRLFICDICGQKFTQKPGLISHRKRHPGQHPPLPKVRLDHALSEFTIK